MNASHNTESWPIQDILKHDKGAKTPFKAKDTFKISSICHLSRSLYWTMPLTSCPASSTIRSRKWIHKIQGRLSVSDQQPVKRLDISVYLLCEV